MANIKLQRGNLSNIQNTSLKDGVLSIAKDTKQVFLDDNDNRIIVGEANYVKSVTYPATVDINGTLSVNTVTTTNSGLMSKEDKTKLDGIETGANKTIVDTELSETSNNPIANSEVFKINSAITNKANKPKCITVTLTTANWSTNAPYTQTVTATGVTTTNIITPSPAPSCYELASSAGVYCSAQAVDNLTFTCKKKPTQNLTYNVVIQEVG